MPEDKLEDKQKPLQLPKPSNAPKPKGSSVKEYGDGASVINTESDKD